MVAYACSPSYSGAEGEESLETWEVEVAVRQDHATVLQPGEKSKTLFQTEKRKIKKKGWGRLEQKTSSFGRDLLPKP